MLNEPMSSRPRRDSDADARARAPASPRPMPLTGSGNGPAGLSPSTGGAAAGGTSRRTLGRKAQAPRVPTKAQQAVDKLLDKIRANADQTPSAAKKETERGEEKRDANGRFAKRTRPGPGRPPGSRNKISKAFKEVLRDLGEGIDVTFKDPATDTLVEGARGSPPRPAPGGRAHRPQALRGLREDDPRVRYQPAEDPVRGWPRAQAADPEDGLSHRGAGSTKISPRGHRPRRGRRSTGTGRGPALAMLGLQRVRPAAHRIWSPHRAVRWVCRLRPTSMIDDVSPCGPVCPSGPITLLGAFHHTPHTFKRARDRDVRGLQWRGAAN